MRGSPRSRPAASSPRAGCRRWRRRPRSWPGCGADPECPTPCWSPRQHGDGGVVAVQPLGGEDVVVGQGHERGQLGGAGPDPVGDGRDAELDALQGIGLALAVQRQVLAELGLQGHGQQVRPRPAAGDRVERRRRLGDGLAGPAGEPLPHGLDHPPPDGLDLQGLGDVLAQLGQLAAAARAGRRAGSPGYLWPLAATLRLPLCSLVREQRHVARRGVGAALSAAQDVQAPGFQRRLPLGQELAALVDRGHAANRAGHVV